MVEKRKGNLSLSNNDRGKESPTGGEQQVKKPKAKSPKRSERPHSDSRSKGRSERSQSRSRRRPSVGRDKRSRSRPTSESMLIGITGGIGSGQSTVAGFLETAGVYVINADKVGKQVLDRDDAARKEIRKHFGRKVFYRNGKVNRKLLAKIAFGDSKKTKTLNKIVHPRMVAAVVEEIEKARDDKNNQFIALDAALIFEIQLEQMFDVVIVVSSHLKRRLARVEERDKLTEEEIRDRIAQQIPIEDKARWADFVIHNNGTVEQLEAKTVSLMKRIQKLYDSQDWLKAG